MRSRVHPVVWLTAGACALRLLAFLGRGDYVAFDEGWYLLLGINRDQVRYRIEKFRLKA